MIKARTGMPIMFDGAVVGLAGVHVMIFFGETERAMLDEFAKRGLLSPDQSAAAYAAAAAAEKRTQ